MRKRRNAFTLVELLAVIVILAVILVIAVPKVISIIDDTKKGTLESTAKMIASAAEKAKVQNQVLGKDVEITCDSVAKLNNLDYERCNIEFIDNKAHVDIKGSGKFENMYVCKGTKDEAHIVNRCPNEKVMVELQPNTEEEFNNISGIYKEGDVIYLDIPTRIGFLFIRWEVVSGDSVLENENKLIVGEDDTIVHAVWENNPSFEVVLDGGVDNVEYKERYQTRTIINLEVPTRENYKFVKWEIVEGSGSLSENTFTMGTEDVVIKAIWELNVFNLTVEPNGGTITQEFKSEYAVGETIILEIPTRENYTFTGWTSSSGTLIENVFTMGTSDVTLTANWEINKYTINYELGGGTNAIDNPLTVIYGSTVTINNPTRENYTFIGWTVSGIGASMNGTSLTIGTGNVTLTASWQIINAIPAFTYTGDYEIVDDNDNVITTTSGNWKIRFLTSGTLKFTALYGADSGIDVFLVGGGGGGASGYNNNYAGGGGGGGDAKTVKQVIINEEQEYEIIIGAGGATGGGEGGTSSAFEYEAVGGKGGSGTSGGAGGGTAGGAGGSGGTKISWNDGYGGTAGKSGSAEAKEFGEENGTQYAGGGGGGSGTSSKAGGAGGAGGKKGAGTPGTDNTGGGGGGGAEYYANNNGSKGGSGIVIIRNAR